jgi:protein-S-isoprenylcysteine O-methyltransferase Ste14
LQPAFDHLFATMWGGWALYWWIASRNVKTAVRRESIRSRLSHVVPIGFATALLLGWPTLQHSGIAAQSAPRSVWVFWVAVVRRRGLLFSVWARVHLGRNWSATVTIKDQHELIADGPYRFVRHPIYTGLLVAILGTALARGDWRGMLAMAIVSWALWRKLTIEERWLAQQFGDDYAAYRRRVAALVPFIL